MDTKTCEICQRESRTDNPVAPLDLGDGASMLACDACCELWLIELDILAVLK